MILKHLLEDLGRIAVSAHPYAETNITDIEPFKDGVYFHYDTTELEGVKDELERANDQVDELQKELEDKEKELEEKEIELSKAVEWIAQIKQDGKGAAFSELLGNNEWQARELTRYKELVSNYLKKFKEDEALIGKLRARKNTAKVMERDRNTGNLIAEYQGKRYILEEIK